MHPDSRPRVDEVVELAPTEVLRRAQEALDAGTCECVGHVGKRHLTLFVPDAERHFWSPWLQVEVLPADAGCRLVGKFGPEPRVWTMFVMMWFALVCAWVAGTMYGFVQLTLGAPPSGLYVTAIATAGLLASCGINIVGQRATRHQMSRARAFLARVTAG